MIKLSRILKLSFCLFLFLAFTAPLQAANLNLKFVLAAKDGDLGTMKAGLKQDVNINALVDIKGFKATTALITAVHGGHLYIVRFLLENEADLALKDAKGRSALSEAVTGNQLEITKLLLKNGADANDTWMGLPMLSLAVRGKIDIMKLLLDNGAKINAKDDQGQTAFASAVPYNHYDMLKLFIDRGVKADFGAALMRAVSAPKPSLKIVNLLLDQGAGANYKDKSGTPVLVKAANRNQADIIKSLLQQGADINATDKHYERTALFWASGFGHADVVRELIKQGAKLNLQDKYNLTALTTATSNNRDEVVKLLKKAGAQ